MKVKHTKNGNVKLTLTLEQATALNWILTHSRLRAPVDKFLDDAEYAVRLDLETALNDARIF